jgi:thiamine transporter ThiT
MLHFIKRLETGFLKYFFELISGEIFYSHNDQKALSGLEYKV